LEQKLTTLFDDHLTNVSVKLGTASR